MKEADVIFALCKLLRVSEDDLKKAIQNLAKR